jgi:hypothetical protein
MQTATVLTSWKPTQRNRDDATMDEIVWHCRETRQSTENTNIVLKSRHGEIPEGLSGSLAPGMLEEKRRELGRPHRLLGVAIRERIMRHARGNPETELGRDLSRPRQVMLTTEKGGGLKVDEESDRPIVLRARESRAHGEGVGRVT